MQTESWRTSLVAALVMGLALPASAEGPLSAIGWLSDSVLLSPPESQVPTLRPRRADRDDIATSARPEAITVSPLGAPSPDTVGLLPARRLGLPADLWGASSSRVLARSIAETGRDGAGLPALRALFKAVLTAELDPPVDSAGDRTLFLARVDGLLALGALQPAARLLDRAGRTEPVYFRRWFDIALLTGTEDQACARMRALPEISPTYAARIFCLARTGDWQAAALTLDSAKALGLVEPAEDQLIARFLLSELAEDSAALPPMRQPTPLQFSMLAAIGEPVATAGLPLAFAHADLRPMTGWKARIDAAERLAREGAIPAARLFDIYAERSPAASGGVWDRVSAVQAFRGALLADDPEDLARVLTDAWAAMRDVGLEVPFAYHFGAALSPLAMRGEADRLRLRIGLLSPTAPAIARAHGPTTREEAFLVALATGDLADTPAPDGMASDLREGFLAVAPKPEHRALIDANRRGEALLQAIALFGEGAEGNVTHLQDAVALLVALDQGDVARRAALELLILEPTP